MKKPTFEEFIRAKSFLRIIPAVGIVLTLITCHPGTRIFQSPEGFPYNQILLALKLLTVAAFIFMLFYPKKFGVYGIQSFLYSIFWGLMPDSFFSSLLNSILCISILLARGFFKKDKAKKIILVILFYLGLCLCQLYYGLDHFIEYFLLWITTWVMLGLSLYYLLNVYYIDMKNAREVPFVLDDCPFLEDEDIYIICRLFQNEKYDSLARFFKVSDRTIKRRCARFYEYYGCSDKLDFFAKYSNHPVVFRGVEYMDEARNVTEAFEKLEKSLKKENVQE